MGHVCWCDGCGGDGTGKNDTGSGVLAVLMMVVTGGGGGGSDVTIVEVWVLVMVLGRVMLDLVY